MYKYLLHCVVNVHDGISILDSRPTKYVEAKNETEAIEKVEKEVIQEYQGFGCCINSFNVVVVKNIGPVVDQW